MLCRKEPSLPTKCVFDERIALLDFCQANRPPNFPKDNDRLRVFSGWKNPINSFPGQPPNGGWFGGMNFDREYGPLVISKIYDHSCRKYWVEIIDLVNRLPLVVYKNDYEQFIIDTKSIISDFVIHSKNQHKIVYKNTKHFSVTTRLLAMSRPDQFFCLNQGNDKKLADFFGIPKDGNKGIKSTAGYWDVVEKLRRSTWATSQISPGWSSGKKSCWHGRTAMVDALVYLM